MTYVDIVEIRRYLPDMLIRPVRIEDTASLRRNCFAATAAEQMEAMVHAALDEQERGETVWLVAIQDDGEVAGSCRGGTHAETAYLGLGFAEWGRLGGGYHDRGDQIFDEVRLWMPISED